MNHNRPSTIPMLNQRRWARRQAGVPQRYRQPQPTLKKKRNDGYKGKDKKVKRIHVQPTPTPSRTAVQSFTVNTTLPQHSQQTTRLTDELVREDVSDRVILGSRVNKPVPYLGQCFLYMLEYVLHRTKLGELVPNTKRLHGQAIHARLGDLVELKIVNENKGCYELVETDKYALRKRRACNYVRRNSRVLFTQSRVVAVVHTHRRHGYCTVLNAALVAAMFLTWKAFDTETKLCIWGPRAQQFSVFRQQISYWVDGVSDEHHRVFEAMCVSRARPVMLAHGAFSRCYLREHDRAKRQRDDKKKRAQRIALELLRMQL
jgi:hypothetical protein